MSDVSIVNNTVTAAPKDYKLSGAQDLKTKAVRAQIDGSGAAGQYVPALQMLDPAGNVMWTAVANTTVTTGGSVNVTWFPGVSAAGSGASASGAWTQVFHFDVPPTGAPTTIDTVGSTWSNSNNQIFGLFNGASTKGTSPDQLLFTVDNDSLGHYTNSKLWGNASPSATPGTVSNVAGGLSGNSSLGFVGATSDSLNTTSIFFVIPKIYQSTQNGTVVSYGGFTGIATAIQGVTVGSYEFSGINRIALTLQSGSAFAQGSSLTLWAV